MTFEELNGPAADLYGGRKQRLFGEARDLMEEQCGIPQVVLGKKL